MPKVRSNAQSAYEAKRKMRESERRDDNLFPEESTRSRKEKYGSRTREAEDRERDRDDDRRRDREDDRDRSTGRRERISDERDPERSRRGREEADRADRRIRQEDRNDSRSDRERSRDSKQLAEIRYQLNKMYNFIQDFEREMSNKERDAWDAICYEADAEEFALSSGRRSSRDRRDNDDDRGDDRRRRRDDRDIRLRRDDDSRNDGPRRRGREDDERDRRRDDSRRGDDEDMRYRRGGKYRGEDRYESNGLCKGDVKKLIYVIKDEKLKFKGRLDDDLFYITDEINMGNYTRKYEDAFLNLLEELDSIKLYEKENRYDIDDLVDIYMPRDSRRRSTDRRDYCDDDRNYDDRRRSSGGRRRRDDDDDYDRDRRSGSVRVRARSRRDDDEDDYYDRREDRRSSGRRRVASSRREDDYDDRDRRDDRRRPSNDSRRRDDDRYSGKNGGNRRSGSGVDFKYLDDVLYDLEGLPGFIDDLSDYGYEAYSYMVTAIRNQDDSTIAEDANVFMEELIADGMDYALTDDEYDFLYNEVATYRSQANRYMGRNGGGNAAPSRRVPGGSRRVVSQGRQPVQYSRRVVSRQRTEAVEEVPVREAVSPRRRPVVRAQEPTQSRAIDRRVPAANGNRYAGRDNCDDCKNYEPVKREFTRYAGRNAVRR